MTFGHEPLDVYRAAIESVGWAYPCCMLTKLAQRGYAVREELGEYRVGELDTDTDSDTDTDTD